MTTKTVTENSTAHPIEDFVWCENCSSPHPADFDTMTLHDGEPYGDGTGCASIQPVASDVPLPENWERSFHATFTDERDRKNGGGYDLWLKSPPLQDFHHPMYYLERS